MDIYPAVGPATPRDSISYVLEVHRRIRIGNIFVLPRDKDGTTEFIWVGTILEM
jgi:hypothetical protein